MFKFLKPTEKKITVSRAQSLTDKAVSVAVTTLRESIRRNNQATIDQYTAQNRILKAKLTALEAFLGVEYTNEKLSEYRKVKVTKSKKSK